MECDGQVGGAGEDLSPELFTGSDDSFRLHIAETACKDRIDLPVKAGSADQTTL